MRTNRCIAPNPALDRGLLTTSLSQKNYKMIAIYAFIPNQLQILFSSGNQAKLHHMIMYLNSNLAK